MAIKSFLCVGLLCLVGTTASAASFSFTGTFQTDNDVQLFTFTVGSTTTVTFLTLSYGGGTNAADQVIPAGGFEPFLTLYDATGSEIGESSNGNAAEVNDGASGYLDQYLQQSVGPGTYTLALTEWFNFPVDGYLPDGFVGGGNPTCDFCDAYGIQQADNWAVDILSVDSASEESATVPEPGSLILLSSGLGCFSWVRRRKLFRI